MVKCLRSGWRGYRADTVGRMQAFGYGFAVWGLGFRV